MALAPLSLVQAVISGGLVFLTVLAERFFGFSVGRRQWMGVGLTALGLALLAVTLPVPKRLALELLDRRDDRLRGRAARGRHAARHVATSWARATSTTACCSASASGILFGVSDVAIKALTGEIGGARHDRAALAVAGHLPSLASVIAFFASARGLQKGEAVPVITLTAAAANVSAIARRHHRLRRPAGRATRLALVLQSLGLPDGHRRRGAHAGAAPRAARRASACALNGASHAARLLVFARRMPSINQLSPQGPQEAQEEALDAWSQVEPGP